MNERERNELTDGYWFATVENSTEDRPATLDEAMRLLEKLGIPVDDLEVEDPDAGAFNIRITGEMLATLTDTGEYHGAHVFNRCVYELHIDAGDADEEEDDDA